MHHIYFRKIKLFIALAFIALIAPQLWAEESNQSNLTFGTFWGELDRSFSPDKTQQINELKKIGFTGIAGGMWQQQGLDLLEEYQTAIGEEPMNIYAGFVRIFFGKDLVAQNAHLDVVIDALAKSDAKLWLILHGPKGKKKVQRQELVAFLHSLAERGKAAGVEVIIYPHWPKPKDVYLIETAEQAIPYLEEVQSDNLFVSLHLSHELKAGNGDRLNEIAAKIKPWLRLATINGADQDAAEERDGWTRTIQPLGMGSYDSSRLLKALKLIGYKGPVLLHTGGGLGKRAPAEHHHTSFKRFQEMVKALDGD